MLNLVKVPALVASISLYEYKLVFVAGDSVTKTKRHWHLAYPVLVALELDLQHLDLVGPLVQHVDLVPELPDRPGLLSQLEVLEQKR
jgi:hypothetical protein